MFGRADVLNADGNATAGHLPACHKDEVYATAVELTDSLASEGYDRFSDIDNNGLTPLQRVLLDSIAALKERVREQYDEAEKARNNLSGAEKALDRAREELATAVAAWPKE